MTTRNPHGAAGLARRAQGPSPRTGSGIGDVVPERSNVVERLLVEPLATTEEDPGGDPYNRAGTRALRRS